MRAFHAVRLAGLTAIGASLFLSGCLLFPPPAGPRHHEPGPEVVVVPREPPAPRHEEPSPMPAPGHVWEPGYWHWTGERYDWEGGRWLPPKADHEYVPPRYRHEGGRWVYRRPHWRRTRPMDPELGRPEPVHEPGHGASPIPGEAREPGDHVRAEAPDAPEPTAGEEGDGVKRPAPPADYDPDVRQPPHRRHEPGPAHRRHEPGPAHRPEAGRRPAPPHAVHKPGPARRLPESARRRQPAAPRVVHKPGPARRLPESARRREPAAPHVVHKPGPARRLPESARRREPAAPRVVHKPGPARRLPESARRREPNHPRTSGDIPGRGARRAPGPNERNKPGEKRIKKGQEPPVAQPKRKILPRHLPGRPEVKPEPGRQIPSR